MWETSFVGLYTQECQMGLKRNSGVQGACASTLMSSREALGKEDYSGDRVSGFWLLCLVGFGFVLGLITAICVAGGKLCPSVPETSTVVPEGHKPQWIWNVVRERKYYSSSMWLGGCFVVKYMKHWYPSYDPTLCSHTDIDMVWSWQFCMGIQLYFKILLLFYSGDPP